ncbi:MOSC domain-containing protein [Piscinibacter terrae]|uniref:MOSC domain-containing protein n=1 Tax=Piscinibacter terrae TaxID=2496871 RepID=A0A3N7HVS8_9BURK|nr:MOSC N-terminal beta barrel domain-containing protein [Albitalea terrae]RQP26488.1 MOSC domain-containing protein [Albitalea terrae]
MLRHCVAFGIVPIEGLSVTPNVRVVATFIHPIKACAAVELPSVTIDRWGAAQGDRRWAVINAEGSVTWAGEFPRLVLVMPELLPQGLRLTALDQAPLDVDDADLPPRTIGIWNDLAKRVDHFTVGDAGDEAAQWMSEVVKAPVRLVRLGDDAVGRDSTNRLHVVSTVSCAEVDELLAQRGLQAESLRRCRPNIVIEGLDAPLVPFIEDHLTQMRWQCGDGMVSMKFTGRSIRCVVPNVDTRTGEAQPVVLESLTTLSAQRWPNEAVSFGIYGRATPGARLDRGQPVEVEFGF